MPVTMPEEFIFAGAILGRHKHGLESQRRGPHGPFPLLALAEPVEADCSFNHTLQQSRGAAYD